MVLLEEELCFCNGRNKSCRGKQGSSVSVMESVDEEDEEGSKSSSSNNGFDCNICLDSVMNPVVTLCGHLYCWPCIYKWLNSAAVSGGGDDVDDDEDYYELQSHGRCPVCKSEVSESELIPLFSHGQTSDVAEKAKSVVPRRPPAPLRRRISPSPRPATLQQRPYEQSMLRGGGLELSGRVPIPVVGMLGEIVFAGNYTQPYEMDGGGSSSPRVRRQMMAAEKSLSRVCFFLVCCVFMCIVLF